MRTKVHNLKDYIKASAVLHQHQRKKDEQGRLIATLDDYEYGRFVFIHLNDAQGGGLNRDEEEFVRVLQEADRPLTINEITSKYRRHGKTWIYDHLESFKQKGLILEEYKKQKSGTVDKDVREISLTKQVIEQGLPDKSVFLRFIETSENGIQDSIPGIPGFTDICKEIDKVRMETNLKPLFSAQSQEKQENKEDNLEEGDSQTEENLRKILEKQHDERNMQ